MIMYAVLHFISSPIRNQTDPSFLPSIENAAKKTMMHHRVCKLHLFVLCWLTTTTTTTTAAPLNDDCTDSTVITSLPFTSSGSTFNSTVEFEFEGTDTTCGVSEDVNGVWFTYTSIETKILKVSINGDNSAGSVLRVFSGNECNSLICLKKHGPFSTGDSEHTWLGEAGVTYKFLISKIRFDQAGFVFNVQLQDYSVPENDQCMDSKMVPSLPYQSGGSSVGALPDFETNTCFISEEANGVWYSYTPTETKIIQVNVNAANSDASVLRLFSGGCDVPFCIAKNGPFSTGDSSHTFIGEAGTTYRFLVSRSDFRLGNTFNIDMEDYPVPENNNCNNGTEILSLPYQDSGSTVGSLPDFDVGTCGVSSETVNGVWYTYIGEGEEVDLRISTSGSSSAPALRIFSGDCNFPFCIQYKGPLSNRQVSYTWLAESGVTYRFLISQIRFELGFPFNIELKSLAPTSSPSSTPSSLTTYEPSESPSAVPSYIPSVTPSYAPTGAPTISPSAVPTNVLEFTQETTENTPSTFVLTPEKIFGDENADIDPDSLQVLQQPMNGNVTLNENGDITYTPDPGFTGKDTFSTQACDVNGECTTLSFLFNITEDKEEPESKDGKEGLYALLGLILAPILWFFQEPLKRCFDRCFGRSDDENRGSKTAGSTVVPSTIGVNEQDEEDETEDQEGGNSNESTSTNDDENSSEETNSEDMPDDESSGSDDTDELFRNL